ncbi:hypothetical protein DW322_11295 [Rhodococcus rhodnii]|uniref:Uncharacterized protein n=2 Tax=Rhodococcus rhodnii TaxID=38312 RepID=R7WRY4_9NOCA|nr:hypothetical protein [Rhodococcus rhodnii]EOM78097.1 hypothetical protein Rrhod_0547 [Rhodococcus rhodnii LMG 5362]TXG90696.1 hypothetical protein DW322_11295 [Rhodococcus rhodnii]
MPTNPKKTAPRAARPKTVEPAEDRFDLLAELATDEQEPELVTLLGVDADIRRSYTGEEAVTFLALVERKDFPAALDLIAGAAGPALWEKIGAMASAHAAKVLNRLFVMSTLTEGELLAPLPTSFAGMAGARPSPGSGATTS